MGCCNSRPREYALGAVRRGSVGEVMVKEIVVQIDPQPQPQPQPQLQAAPERQPKLAAAAAPPLVIHGVPISAREAAAARLRPEAGVGASGSARPAAAQPGNRVVRVFLSSTFQDMQAERDAIRALVNPSMKRLCAERGVFYHAVDLRWGITDDACKSGMVTLLCLREVERSNYFAAFVKARYGWHLNPNASAEDEGNALFRLNLERAAGEFPWVREWEDRSVTEIEIRAGALRDVAAARGRSMFYFASPSLSAAAAASGGGEGPYAAARLEALKGDVRASGLPLEEYGTPEELARAIRSALTDMLERDHPLSRTTTWLEFERSFHGAFGETRRRAFVRDPSDDAALDGYAGSDGPQALAVVGPNGCGKSSLLASWSHAWAEGHPGDVTVAHFVGGTYSSSLLSAIARRISEEVRAKWPDQEPIDFTGSDAEVSVRLARALARGAQEWPARVVLVIDGVDQLSGGPAARDLAWLPAAAGPRLRLLLSTPRGPALRAAEQSGRPLLVHEVGPLGAGRRAAVGRALSEERAARIAASPHAASPLFLVAVLEELSAASVHARLDDDLARMLACEGPVELYRLILRRLAARHGRDLVQDAACAVACTRHGIAEAELVGFLHVDAPGGPPNLEWCFLWQEFLPLVVNRQSLYSFTHRCTQEAVEREFGVDPNPAAGPSEFHGRLGEFFAGHENAGRMAEEAPWALARAGRGRLGALAAAMCQPEILNRLDPYEAARVWRLAGAEEEAAARYGEGLGLRGAPGGASPADPAALEVAGAVLDALGRPRAALPFLQEALRLRRAAAGGPGAEDAGTAAAASDLAELYRKAEDYEAAEALYKEALGTMRRVLGPEDPTTASVAQNYGAMLRMRGEAGAGRPLLEEALRVYRAALGDLHPHTGAAAGNLAGALEDLGERAAARPLYQEALEIRRRALGHDHPETGTAAENLGSFLVAGGDLEAGVPLLEEAVRVKRGALGPSHPELASALVCLGYARQQAEQFQAARELYQEALEIRRGALGAGHPIASVADVAHRLGQVCDRMADWEDAQKLYEEAAQAYEAAGDPRAEGARADLAAVTEFLS
eukprot:tig00020903_g15075.t1